MKKLWVLLCVLLLLAVCNGREATVVAGQYSDDSWEFWLLREDGTFIHAEDFFNSYEIGRWRISGGKLRLEIDEYLRCITGEKFEDGALMMYETLELPPLQPSKKEAYRIAQTGDDPESGRRAISIDGKNFFECNEQPMFMEIYEELRQRAALQQ